MEPVQGVKELVLADVAAFTRPVLGVFDEIADRQPDVALDRGEDADHPAPPANLHVQPLMAVGRGDPLLVDLREVKERQRVFEAFFQTTDGLGEPLFVVVDERGSRRPGALLVRLEPDLLQMGREASLLPMGNLGQDVPHEVDLTTLPGGAEPFLTDRGLEAGMRTGRIDAAGDHHGHRDHPAFDPDLLIQGVDPQEGVLLGQRTSLEVLNLGVEFLVELRDMAGRDVLDTHRPSQPLDLPGRKAVDEGLLNDRDQRLFRPAFLRDEEREIAAIADLGDQQINRPHPGIDPPGPSAGEVGRAILSMLTLGRADLGLILDPHHLGHHPLEHGQEGVGFGDEL